MKINFLIILNFIFLLFINNNFVNAQAELKCSVQNACEQCLLADVRCAWCTEKDYGMIKPRCLHQTQMYKSTCSKENVIFNKENDPQFISNENLRDYRKNSLDAIQIQPQKIKLKLYKSITKTIKMKYKPANNYPLDLYYLMDLTVTMNNHKETLIGIGTNLANELQNLTENYRIGFGSFVDKPALPMTFMHKLDNPCTNDETCVPTYSFWHQMSLSKNISQFIDEVKQTVTSANVDVPEGGLDALMQVLACTERIGWTMHSRKIIIYSTDGDMHFAGDGMLAGAIKKNDKKCHLSADGRYLGALEFDYPSLEEIYRFLLVKKTNVIFLVNDEVEHFYNEIHNLMPEITNVGKLKVDSSNILELVKNGYSQFIRYAQFTNDAPRYISVVYETTCGGEYSTPMRINHCDNVELGKEYEFNILITLLDFPKNSNDYNQIIKISERSLSSDALEIEIEIEKPCSNLNITDSLEKNSPICNENGDYFNGECLCRNGWIGKTCDCNLKNNTNILEMERFCRSPSSYNNLCSDHGDCVCGECYCSQGYVGKYCDCPPCPIWDGHECGASGLVKCNCGICECDEGWTGNDCTCPTSTESCIPPNSDNICSGKGNCKCGECTCQGKYHGHFCEKSIDADISKLCEYFEPCVRCKILEKEKSTEKCTNTKDLCRDKDKREFITEFFKDLSDQKSICIVRITKDELVCQHKFSYHVDENKHSQIRIILDQCKPINTALIGGIVAALTFLLGILIVIICKVRCMISDSREYAKFEKERQNQELNMECPIYKSPITHFEMPVTPETEPVFDFNR